MKYVMPALIIILSILVLYSFLYAENEEIIITAVEGRVERLIEKDFLGIFKIKEYEQLNKNTILKSGDLIRTGINGKLEFYFTEGIFIKVGPETEIVIEKGKVTKRKISLDTGRIWVKVKKIWGDLTNFEVVTPSAIAGVKGTVFSVYVKDNKTLLSVKEGVVEFTDNAGTKSVLVKSGQMSQAYSGKVSEPEVINKEEKEHWSHSGIFKWLEEEIEINKKNTNVSIDENIKSEEEIGKDKEEDKGNMKENNDNKENKSGGNGSIGFNKDK